MSIWTILFVILLIAWISGFTVFHVAGGLIHLLLIFAMIISLVLHFVMGGRRAVLNRRPNLKTHFSIYLIPAALSRKPSVRAPVHRETNF